MQVLSNVSCEGPLFTLLIYLEGASSSYVSFTLLPNYLNIHNFRAGPRNGGQLIGPIDDTNEHHACYTDYILAGLAKSAYSKNLSSNANRTVAQLEEAWKADYAYQCRTTCPGHHDRLFLPEDGESDDDDRDIMDSPPHLLFTTQHERNLPRRSARMASSSSASTSTLSPLVDMLNVAGPAPFPMDPPSPSLRNATFPLPMPTSATTHEGLSVPPPEYILADGCQPDFTSFEDFEARINATRRQDILNSNDLFFSVEGMSVREAAAGLVSALMGVGMKTDATLYSAPPEPDNVRFAITPAHVTLETIFSYQHWSFRA